MTGETEETADGAEQQENMDDDIACLAETKQQIEDIKAGRKRVIDKETELEGHRYTYNRAYEEAVLGDEITDIEIVEDPDEMPNHPVRAETERFDIIGKFGDEKHDSTDEVIFVMVEHRETGLEYNQVNGAIGEKVTTALP